MNDRAEPPSLFAKDYAAASVFRPENLLREARRQKRLKLLDVPEVCLLDPDGDIVRNLRATGRAAAHPGWACYHTELDVFEHAGERFGIIGCAVGAPFAVLVAEQLFVCGCRLLVSITSSGRIGDLPPGPCFVLIDRALRDEGTSLHYLPPGQFAEADRALADAVWAQARSLPVPVYRGAVWTTDAPFRETEAAIAAARTAGALAVEMEAAALYAFARVRRRAVVCFAHVTNEMAQDEGDFEKGEEDGTRAALAVAAAAARGWRCISAPPPAPD